MIFGGGEVAMPAAAESTAEEALTISVDSATTEEDKKPKPSSSAPRTTSQPRSSSAGTRKKASERRPAKTVIQCLQSSKKGKDREPRNPEQTKSRSSSRSTSRKASARQAQSSSAMVRHAEERMRIFRQEDLQQHEAIVMNLTLRLNQLIQEDQGSTMRIEELERQRNMLRSAVEHVNLVHQNSKEEYVQEIWRIEEARYAQHLRDEEVAASLRQELGRFRSEAVQSFVNFEQQAQGEGQYIALEYKKLLVDELNKKAHENLQFRMEASQNQSAVVIMKERMNMLKEEENAAQEKADERVLAMETGARALQSRLDKEAIARSEATVKMEHAAAFARQAREPELPLTALHDDLGEPRHRRRQQEELQVRSQQAWKQEFEAARRQAHQASQQSSSMPLSPKTSDAGWEYVSSQVSSQKGLSFPVGVEVRSPDLAAPTQYSPINRAKIVSEVQPDPVPVVQDVNMDQPAGPSLPSSTDSAQLPTQAQASQENAENNVESVARTPCAMLSYVIFLRCEACGSHLRLLHLQHGHTRTSDDVGTDRLIAELVERDVRVADEGREQGASSSQTRSTTHPATSSTSDSEHLARMEAKCAARMDELLSELRQAKRTEDRLRDDRDNWRQTAECYQQDRWQNENHDEGEEEEVTPSESPTNLGPSGPGGGSGDPDNSPSRGSGRRGGDLPGPPSEGPTDTRDHDVTEVKISRREADKIVAHLDSWMAHCIALLLSACADPRHEDWINWLKPAFRPNPDIEEHQVQEHRRETGRRHDGYAQICW